MCFSEVRIYGGINVPDYNMGMGGTLSIKSEGNIILWDTGWINADAAGQPGGAKSGQQGTGGYGGGGMGPGCGGGPGNSVGQGGTGAAYGGLGGTPNNTWANNNPCNQCSQANVGHCEGVSGPVYGTANGADFAIGSGGGAGGNSSGCTNSGAPGGRGGGAVLLASNTTVGVDGLITVNGEQPPTDNSNCGYRPGGGGGSGGAIVLAAAAIEGGGGGNLVAHGGNGGAALGETGAQTWGWGGGGGGGGRIKLFGSNQFAGSTSVTAGAGGTAPNTSQSFPGDPGAAGSVAMVDAVPMEYMNISCN